MICTIHKTEILDDMGKIIAHIEYDTGWEWSRPGGGAWQKFMTNERVTSCKTLIEFHNSYDDAICYLLNR